MGSVYLGYDPKMGREVAVKVLQKEFARNPKHRQRFDREAKAIAALKHPNIVDIYDYGGSPDEHLFLVMEYIKGPHTGQLCREHGVLPESALICLGLELAKALRHAHRGGIIHRDLKPENVFLDAGRVVLADFGIAKAIAEVNPFGREAADAKTDIIGTPGFMAPEQLEQLPLDARTDIFSFGALLYYLGSRNLPFDADSPYELVRMFRDSRPTPLADLRPELSEEISRLVQDCLEAEPSARPSSMDEVASRLRDILERIGAREPREILQSYEDDPIGFRAIDRARLVHHLIGRLKIAVRDQDGITADEVRARLAVLDPENEEAARVTGVQQLLASTRRPLTPLPYEPSSYKGLVIAAVVLTLVAAGVTAYVTDAFSWVTDAASDHIVRREVTMLRVRANERTHVFIDGHALGTTPNFPPAMVPSGEVALEFVSGSKERLRYQLTLIPGEPVTVVVDWRNSRVKVRKTRRRPRR